MTQRTVHTAAALLILAVASCAAPAAAQPAGGAGEPYFSTVERHRTANIAMAERNLLKGLMSPCDGVVQSSMAQLIVMKVALPERSFSRVESSLRMLSVTGRTPEIRRNAYLACSVFDDARILTAAVYQACQGPDELFEAVAQGLQRTAVSQW